MNDELNFFDNNDPAEVPLQASNGTAEDGVQPVPDEASESLQNQINEAGGEFELPPEYKGSVGRTMFDTPVSKDGTVTVLLPRVNIEVLPNQALVRIKSVEDGRNYLGAVVEGPFAEPDGLRGDAAMLVTAGAHGMFLMPKHHGRVQVQLLGEEREGGGTVPPRWRPKPNSPVFPLDDGETEAVLGSGGDIWFGMAEGHGNVNIRVPSNNKGVFPRHVGVLGTTGGGKSTTVSGLIDQAQEAGMSIVVLDTEGEYCAINEPTESPSMKAELERRGLQGHGVSNTHVLRLVGREAKNPAHPSSKEFGIRFSDFSPYAVAEILGLSDAQDLRFFEAYDVAKKLLEDMKEFPAPQNKEHEGQLMEWDEMETGYPHMTLGLVMDVVGAKIHKLKEEEGDPFYRHQKLKADPKMMAKRLKVTKGENIFSWLALMGKLGRLNRYNVFDVPKVSTIDFEEVLSPGRVTLIDLSDLDSPQLRNLVIAQVLRGVHVQQDICYGLAAKANTPPRPALILIEEAHEFLSAERIKQMPVLFQQVARIARRGRKRWLGLGFISQLPQHLPDEVLALINNWVLHKIGDSSVISRLKRSIGGIDDSVWQKLPNLAPGQAVVTFTTLTRPTVVAINPTPCKLLMAD